MEAWVLILYICPTSQMSPSPHPTPTSQMNKFYVHVHGFQVNHTLYLFTQMCVHMQHGDAIDTHRPNNFQ